MLAIVTGLFFLDILAFLGNSRRLVSSRIASHLIFFSPHYHPDSAPLHLDTSSSSARHTVRHSTFSPFPLPFWRHSRARHHQLNRPLFIHTFIRPASPASRCALFLFRSSFTNIPPNIRPYHPSVLYIPLRPVYNLLSSPARSFLYSLSYLSATLSFLLHSLSVLRLHATLIYASHFVGASRIYITYIQSQTQSSLPYDL
jgi:hypothetical protein